MLLTTVFGSTAFAASGNNYDITEPVLEQLTFVQSGQALQRGDDLTVLVQAYDAESDIENISVDFYSYSSNSSITHWYTIQWSKGEDTNPEDNVYTLSGKVPNDISSSKLYIEAVYITDSYSNRYYKYYNMDGNENWITITNPVLDGTTPSDPSNPDAQIKIGQPVLSANVLNKDEDLTITIPVVDDRNIPKDVTSIESRFYSSQYAEEDVYAYQYYRVKMTYDAESKELKGRIPWDERLLAVDFNLDADVWVVSQTDENSYTKYLYLVDEDESIDLDASFKVENDADIDYSVQFEMTKTSDVANGFYGVGDKATLSMEQLAGQYDNVWFYLSGTKDSVNEDQALKREVTDNAWEQVFTVHENTYPCEYYLNNVSLSCYTDDEYGFSQLETNVHYLDREQNYFRVKNKNTYAAPTGSLQITLDYVNNKNEWTQKRVSADNITSRSMTYRELFEENEIELSDMTNEYEFVGFSTDDMGYKRYIDLDSNIIFDRQNDSRYIYASAKYKGVEFVYLNSEFVNVEKYSYDTKEYYSWGYKNEVCAVPEVMGSDAHPTTVGDILKSDYLPTPVEVKGLTFNGWEFRNNDVNEDDLVTDVSRFLNLRASYKEGNVAIVRASYIGTMDWGNYPTEKSTGGMAIYQTGDTYGDVIEQFLKKQDFESHPEMGSYSWKVKDYRKQDNGNWDVNISDEIPSSYADINMNADYKDKCIVRFQINGISYMEDDKIVDKNSTIQLPSMRGNEDDYSYIKDIIWTAYSTQNDGMHALEEGATSIVVKDNMWIYGSGTMVNNYPTYSPVIDEDVPEVNLSLAGKSYTQAKEPGKFNYSSVRQKVGKVKVSVTDETSGSYAFVFVADKELNLDKLYSSFFENLEGEEELTYLGYPVQYVEGEEEIDIPMLKDGKHIIYVVASDWYDNMTVVSSDGIIIDNTAPVITGIENGKTYTGETKFAVTETNLKNVTVEGKEIKADNGVYTLQVADGPQEITVTDKAGNTTTVKVTVEKAKHYHSYEAKTISDTYLASKATCTTAATYYYACSCGEKGDKTYSYGNALGHNFSADYTVDKHATTKEAGWESKHCSRCDETSEGRNIPRIVVTQTGQKVDVKPTTLPEEKGPKPGVAMKEEVVTETVANITAAAETGAKQVVVEMGEATVISKDILTQAKEKGVDVVLQMNGYSWTIDAKDIKGANLEDINLEVDLHSEAIPNKAVSKLAGDNPVTQISLSHEGNFGFAATLAFNLGSEYKDQFGNLYWYDSSGKMVFIDSGLIDADGNVNLTFSHASDYAIVMKETDDALTVAKEEASTGGVEKASQAPTPWGVWVVVIAGAAVLVVIAVMFLRKKRQ